MYMLVEATGTNARLASHVPRLLAGEPENDAIDAQGIQSFYTGLVARATNMSVIVTVLADKVSIEARSVAEPVSEPALAEASEAS